MGQNSASHWHDAARHLKESGVPVVDIAAMFGRTPQRVSDVTKGIKAPERRGQHKKRYKPTIGFSTQEGALKKVAINFPSEQIAAVNIIAEARNTSFSQTVCILLDMALEEVSA